MTAALAQFVLDNGRAVIARWDAHRGDVVYEQERKRPAGDTKESSSKINPAGR